MASVVPRPSLSRFFFEPLSGLPLVGCGILVWLAGAAYCHGYQWLLTGEETGSWSGSLIWSAVAVVPWFALFEWSKQRQGVDALRRPALLVALVLGIAAVSIALEYFVDFCLGDVTDHFWLLVMRRLPAIGASILLIAVTRKAVLRRPPAPALVELSAIAEAIDWVAAADNYVELHSAGKVSLRRMTMREAAKTLERHGFVRVHRRYLVNKARIVAVDERSVKLVSGDELPVGTAFAANLAAADSPLRHINGARSSHAS
jgi:hypothetical protein